MDGTTMILNSFLKIVQESLDRSKKEKIERLENEKYNYTGDIIQDMDTLMKIIIERKKVHIQRKDMTYDLIILFRHDDVDYYVDSEGKDPIIFLQDKITVIYEESYADGRYVHKRFFYDSDVSFDICYEAAGNIENADEFTFILVV
jgi:hypothetical protein